jgi:hypothetical protein
MRQRHDFYTLCPSCETRVSLTLAARLQAARHGTTCHCPSCQNEWNCIQEWIYRDTPNQFLSQPAVAPAAVQAYEPQQPQTYAAPMTQHPAHTQTPAAMPRPHMLPTYQPPQHSQPQMPAAQQQMQPAMPQPAQEAPPSQPAPAPHAWSFERQPQASKQTSGPSQYDRYDR